MSAPRPPVFDGLRPGGCLAGEVRVPGSKSLAQRQLLAAAVTGGRTRLAAFPDGEDVAAALALVRALGVDVARPFPGAVSVQGRPPGPSRGLGMVAGPQAAAPTAAARQTAAPRTAAPRTAGTETAGTETAGPGNERRVELGESGTLARLATALVGLCGCGEVRFLLEPRGTLARRASPALLEALAQAGVGLERVAGPNGTGGEAGSWPLRVRPVGPPPTVVLRYPASSQEVSALLLALAAWPDELVLEVVGEIPSRPYVDLTRAVLRDFGVEVGELRPGTFLVPGPLVAPEVPLRVEPDASAAAVALAAGCLGSSGSGPGVRVRGLGADSPQGDVRIVEHLRAFGCEAEAVGNAGTPELRAHGAPKRGAALDLTDAPDLAPVLAAVAGAVALAGCGASRLTGLGTLPGKESSRIEVLAAGLRAVGCGVEADDESLAVHPEGDPVHGPSDAAPAPVILDPHGDHRMAFAFALLGLVRPGVRVRDPGCVAKSWPGFWDDLARAGAHRLSPGEA